MPFVRFLAAQPLLIVMGACSSQAGPTQAPGPAETSVPTSPIPTASEADAGSPPATSSTATLPAPDRCTITSDKNLTTWRDEDWKKCERTRCSRRDDLHGKLSVSIGIPEPLSDRVDFDSAKEFMSGATDVVHLLVRNVSQSDVEVPLVFALGVSPADSKSATFLSPLGKSSDTSDACTELARCVVLSLKPGVAYGYNVITVPMQRRSSQCGPLLPTAKLKPGEYTLEVRTHIEAIPPIVGSKKVHVRASSIQMQ